MTRTLLATLVPVLLLAACTAQDPAPATDTDTATTEAADPAPSAADALAAAVAGNWRTSDFAARDKYRHPAETLAFFGIAPDQTVIEITPGGGWYAEILAPYLRDDGTYIAAVWDDAIPDQPGYRYRLNEELRAKFADNPEVYGAPEVRVFDPKAPAFGPAGSADAVVTFRNAHNWVAAGDGEAYFSAFFDVLAPGGTLGVVDHRAKPGTDAEAMNKSGYLTEAVVIELATAAGFELADRSEINANPADTADHPNGVWTLPPSNRHDDADAEKYAEIGESDRMTLRFVKPAE
ncbi:class I SAM-dependent methyltransferase [Marilutibacter alkalisoli]|uniref:Class I SAM-dependent methyltransferase n=1 Tax=Marilutibacter alkalisoli TaxID=2591633 RepID=A0A514BW22_9GAMM|nr:class I SAM-dependent methyltransferase [Lysobacter alkalisoli]QDH71577.1 class I SAM-dependent methyltransferase [Lysobacter alkalisoli]